MSVSVCVCECVSEEKMQGREEGREARKAREGREGGIGESLGGCVCK